MNNGYIKQSFKMQLTAVKKKIKVTQKNDLLYIILFTLLLFTFVFFYLRIIANINSINANINSVFVNINYFYGKQIKPLEKYQSKLPHLKT